MDKEHSVATATPLQPNNGGISTCCWVKGVQYPTGLGVYMHFVRYGGGYIKELAAIFF